MRKDPAAHITHGFIYPSSQTTEVLPFLLPFHSTRVILTQTTGNRTRAHPCWRDRYLTRSCTAEPDSRLQRQIGIQIWTEPAWVLTCKPN